MTSKPRVFISRTTAGVKALAERVAEVLRQRGIEPIIQTGFYPSTHDVYGLIFGTKRVTKSGYSIPKSSRARPIRHSTFDIRHSSF